MSHTVLQEKEWDHIDSTSLNYFVPEAIERMLVFAVGMENATDTTVTNVTWGGQDMTAVTAISTSAAGEKNRGELWVLMDDQIVAAGSQPAQGFSFNISWSSGEPTIWFGAAGVYKYVDQDGPIGVSSAVEDSTDPIDNPITTTLDSEPGSINIAVAVCNVADDYFWEAYWNQRIERIDGITLGVASRIYAQFNPNNVEADFQGTPGRQLLIAAEFHRSSLEAPEILVDNESGAATPDQLFVEFDIDIGNQPNKFLAIAVGYEYGIDTTGYTSLCQLNGDDCEYVATSTAGCTDAPECVGIHNTTEMFYYVAPPDGTNTIRVECTMTETTPGDPTPRDFMVSAVSLYNVGPPAILSVLTDFDNEPLPTVISVQHPTEDLTANAIIIDSLVMGNPLPPLTGQANQIKVADQQGIGATSSRSTLAIKYAESTPLGESTWQQFSDPGEPGLRAAMVSMAIDSYSDSTSPTFICTDTTIEDVTLEFCEDRDLFRMNVANQGDDVDVDFEFDTCTLQVLTIITSGTSSRNLRFTYEGTPITLSPNDSEDVSGENIYLTATGPYYLPTLVLEGAYSITFI